MKFHYQIKGRTTIGWVSAIEVETTIGATIACKLAKCPLISCPQLDVIAHYVHNELHGMPEITFATAVCHADDKFDAEKGIAMCFVKRSFNNRGCYNDWIKKILKENGVDINA